MKKIILLASIVLFAMTSCSKSENENGEGLTNKRIGFDSQIGKGSKAPVSGTTFPTNMDFGVWSFYGASAGNYDYLTPYIDGVKASYNGTAWATQVPYYWPLSGVLKFVAYAPFLSGTPTYNATDGLVFTNYQILPATADVNDFMYTADDAAINLNSTSHSGGTVPLTFKHALTQVYFTAETEAAGFTFTIKKIELLNVVQSGTFKTISGWVPSTDSGDAVTYTYYDDATGAAITSVDANPYAFSGRQLLIPQALASVRVKVTYDIKDPEDNVVAGATKQIDLTGSWSMNQQVKYALSFLPGTEITYVPVIIDWAAETTGTTN